jgi:L-lactate permease
LNTKKLKSYFFIAILLHVVALFGFKVWACYECDAGRTTYGLLLGLEIVAWIMLRMVTLEDRKQLANQYSIAAYCALVFAWMMSFLCFIYFMFPII